MTCPCGARLTQGPGDGWAQAATCDCGAEICDLCAAIWEEDGEHNAATVEAACKRCAIARINVPCVEAPGHGSRLVRHSRNAT